MTVYGYARVSTQDQHPELQRDTLEAAGCAVIHEERASASGERPIWEGLYGALESGDTLMVWKLDRLCRSTKELLLTLDALHERGVSIRVLTLPVDPSTPAGRMFITITAAFAEYERAIMLERTAAGLAAARRRGRVGGRPRALNAEREALARRLLAEGRSQREVARTLGTSKSVIQRLGG